MKRFILALMICTSLVAAQFTVTRREEGDNFVWSSSTVHCNDFTDTHWYSSDGCECNGDLTFSTEIKGCKSYENEGNSTTIIIMNHCMRRVTVCMPVCIANYVASI